MYLTEQTRPAPTPIPGVAHATWACRDSGAREMSLWRQTLAPGGATPPHSHDCEEIVLCQSGRGELHVDGKVLRFGADSTLTLPRDVPHQIFNTGTQPLEMVAVFAATPVNVYLPDGQKLELPWAS